MSLWIAGLLVALCRHGALAKGRPDAFGIMTVGPAFDYKVKTIFWTNLLRECEKHKMPEFDLDMNRTQGAHSFDEAVQRLVTQEFDILAGPVEADGPYRDKILFTDPVFGSPVVLIGSKFYPDAPEVVYLKSTYTLEHIQQPHRIGSYAAVLPMIKKPKSEQPATINVALDLVRSGQAKFLGRFPIMEQMLKDLPDGKNFTAIVLETVYSSFGVARSSSAAVAKLNSNLADMRVTRSADIRKYFLLNYPKATFIEPPAYMLTGPRAGVDPTSTVVPPPPSGPDSTASIALSKQSTTVPSPTVSTGTSTVVPPESGQNLESSASSSLRAGIENVASAVVPTATAGAELVSASSASPGTLENGSYTTSFPAEHLTVAALPEAKPLDSDTTSIIPSTVFMLQDSSTPVLTLAQSPAAVTSTSLVVEPSSLAPLPPKPFPLPHFVQFFLPIFTRKPPRPSPSLGAGGTGNPAAHATFPSADAQLEQNNTGVGEPADADGLVDAIVRRAGRNPSLEEWRQLRTFLEVLPPTQRTRLQTKIFS